jgi:hypothetical protein
MHFTGASMNNFEIILHSDHRYKGKHKKGVQKVEFDLTAQYHKFTKYFYRKKNL